MNWTYHFHATDERTWRLDLSSETLVKRGFIQEPDAVGYRDSIASVRGR